MEGKTPRETEVVMSELVLPNDTNVLGNLMGGKLMYWIDIAGALVASRHSNKVVATVYIDNISFKHPVRMGEMLIIKAKMVYVGKTSMSVKVRVYAENMKSNSEILTNEARIVLVALDDEGRPCAVPRLIPETEEEKAEFEKERLKKEGKNNSK
ncbi:MAG: putative acyl-CoA thioester hydrolase [Firmicutes bacterium ADurb.Bin193]|nr:MAG: putative acyl-CoA thioester hydrolase [Firmicutes bacterium ADurb.Bin193]